MTGERFVVEANRQVVGIAIRVPGGFQFFATHPSVIELDGRVFARAKKMVRLANELVDFHTLAANASAEPDDPSKSKQVG